MKNRFIKLMLIALAIHAPLLSLEGVGTKVAAQSHLPSPSDLALLRSARHDNPAYADRQVRYGFTPGRRTANPAYHALSSAMYLYQRFVSPVIMRRCAFTPTCSAYSKALIRQYGLLPGSLFTADRLMRCNRISLTDLRYHRLAAEGRGYIHESVLRYQL